MIFRFVDIVMALQLDTTIFSRFTRKEGSYKYIIKRRIISFES